MQKSLNDVYEGLKQTGLPVTYREWEKDHVPPLPYIVFYATGKDPFYADNKMYYLSNVVTVELYTDYKDEQAEALLESFFYTQNITASDVYETYWADEHLHEVSYEFEI